jgi:hypothetical protein
MQAYEREQEMTEGEIGVRNACVEDGGVVPRVKESHSVHDKEERKREGEEKAKGVTFTPRKLGEGRRGLIIRSYTPTVILLDVECCYCTKA